MARVCCLSRPCLALTRKNASLKLRTPVTTLLELALPLAFVLAMYGLQGLFDTTYYDAKAYPSVGSIAPLHGLGFALRNSKKVLAVTSSSPAGAAAAQAFVADLASTYSSFNGSTFANGYFASNGASQRVLNLYLPSPAEVVQMFDSQDDLTSYVEDLSYGDASHPLVYAAIVFNSGWPSFDYSLRFNRTEVPSTNGQAVNTYANTYDESDIDEYLGQYSISTVGFLSVQLAVDRFILSSTAASASAASPTSQSLPPTVTNVSTTSLDPMVAGEALVNAVGYYQTPTSFDLQQALAAVDPATPGGQQVMSALQQWYRSESRLPQQVEFVPFPTPAYKINPFYQFVLSILTLFLVIAYVYPVSQLIRGVVQEKELRLREVLKIMGATDGDIWASWFATYAALYAVLCAAITGVCTQVFPNSDSGVIFILFYLYSLSSIGWAFLVSVFFTKSRTASILGGLAWLAGYFAYFGIDDSSDIATKGAAGLLAPTALGLAMDIIGTLETNGVGATRVSAVTQVINQWNVASSIGLLFFDVLLYVFLAWYLDQVLPSWAREYGVPRPWYFLVTPSYWAECMCGLKRRRTAASDTHAAGGGIMEWAFKAATGQGKDADGQGVGAMGGAPGYGTVAKSGGHAPPLIQAYDSTLTAKEAAGRCVAVKGLRKVFPAPTNIAASVSQLGAMMSRWTAGTGGNSGASGTKGGAGVPTLPAEPAVSGKVAVESLDLTFFEGQVTCLLGHNGAGKTTTLQILSGLIEPSGGTATAFGLDILHEQDNLRSMLGICPQHDVLWPELTVVEHMRLFAALKRAPADRVEAECAASLKLIGLSDKSAAQVKTLSGGMKRKLSIALAFLGGSRIVFLDEPTSGVDPYSRRAMWELIQSQRDTGREDGQGRVIILTTHFMDEADILGDRIAIMHSGRLNCVGTSVFLKEAFGVGYTCTIVKRPVPVPGAPKASTEVLTGREQDEEITALVKKYVPAARVASSAGSELLLRLPLASSPSFASLLRALAGDGQGDPSLPGAQGRYSGPQLGVTDVGMHVTSLEDVFLKIAQDEGTGLVPSSPLPTGSGTGTAGADSDRMKRVASMKDPQSDVVANPLSEASMDAGEGGASAGGSLSKEGAWVRPDVPESGHAVFFNHVGAILVKRANVGKRDYRAICCLILCPLIVLCAGLALLLNALAARSVGLVMSTAQFNAGPFRGPGTQGTGTSSGSAAANYIPAISFKSSDTDNAVVLPDLVTLVNTLPAVNASTDKGQLLLTPSQLYNVQDTYGFIQPGVAQPVRDYQRMSVFLLNDAPRYAESKYGAFVFTGNGTVVGDQSPSTAWPGSGGQPLTAGIMINTTASHAGPIFLNLLDIGLLRRVAGLDSNDASGPSITVRSFPLPLTASQKRGILSVVDIISLQPLFIALTVIPAAAAQFIVKEREVAAKHQQTISGVSLAAYWIGNFCFDVVSSITSVLLLVIVLAGFNVQGLISTDRDRAGATVLLLLGFAGATTSFTYVISHAFKSPSAAQAAIVMLNMLQFALVVASPILQQVPSTCTGFLPAMRALDLLPFYATGQGLSAVSLIDSYKGYAAQCDASNGRASSIPGKPTTAFDPAISGYPLLYLAAETPFFLLIAWLIDYLRGNMAAQKTLRAAFAPLFSLCSCRRTVAAPAAGTAVVVANPMAAAPAAASSTSAAPQTLAAHQVEDADVMEERLRIDAEYKSMSHAPGVVPAPVDVESGRAPSGGASSAGKDLIVLSHLRKVWPGGKAAVQDLCFGVPSGQVFGFLGVNGAGKTTTLQMLSGDSLPTSGTALMSGHDIIEEQMRVRRLLGYCPQFDAHLDLLTCRETLTFYGRIKGIPAALLPMVVSQALRDFDIADYEHALAGTLSGGNKRKLSVAVALIGRPPIVFLDEPSTGVDPVARRKLWGIVSRAAVEQKGCSIILTTHSMEEAEALCTRIGIMVGGRLRCLGTPQRLRTVHGSGYISEVRVAQPGPEALQTVGAALASIPGVSTNGVLTQAQLPAACAALGTAHRMQEIAPHGRGWAIAAAIATVGNFPASDFALWWAEETAVDVVLYALCGPNSPLKGTALRQRQGRSLTLDVPAVAAEGKTLADLFEIMETMRTSLATPPPAAGVSGEAQAQSQSQGGELLIESITLSQTSLEQIFNRMAGHA